MISDIWYVLFSGGRKTFLKIVFASLLVGIIEVVTISSIFPFISLLNGAEPKWAGTVSEAIGISEKSDFLMIFSAIVGVLFLGAAIAKVWAQVVIAGYVNFSRHFLSERLLSIYLSQNFDYFVKVDASELKKKMLSEVEIVVGKIISPVTSLVSQSVMFLAIASLLLYVNFAVSMVACFILGACYFMIFYFSQKTILRIGKVRESANRERFKVADEIFGGIKDIKSLNAESFFLQRFATPSFEVSNSMRLNDIYSQAPKYIVEGVVFCALFLGCSLVAYTHREFLSSETTLPLIALFGFAGYRLLPVIQALYMSTNQIRYGGASLVGLVSDLKKRPRPILARNTHDQQAIESIELRNIGYSHVESGSLSIKNISIKLPSKGMIGIAGGSGAGKTTLVDVMNGLLFPSHGEIYVNGIAIEPSNLEEWRSQVGYVSQDPFLFNASIAENVAVGISMKDIDFPHVKKVCELADIAEFIENNLSDSYLTQVGERGVRLSGGQRQRISIARALYNNPNLIIFDEATSALDNITERTVIESLAKLEKNVLIVMIAHRLSTLEQCRSIILMDEGRCVGFDKHDVLKSNSEYFRRMLAGEVK